VIVGLSDSLTIASSGLDALQSQMSVASQNVANASTTGYVAETVSLSSRSAGSEGSGVVVGLTTRIVDDALESSLYSQNATVSALQTVNDGLSTVSALQGSTSADPGASGTLSGNVGNVQSSLLTLEADPSNAAAQQAVVSAANTLASGLRDTSTSYQAARQAAQDSIVTEVQSANTALGQIGKLSDQIAQLRADGLSTADLENQRATVMSDLSSTVSVRYQETSNGDMLVSMADGTALPTHQNSGPLATTNSTLDAASVYPGTIPAIALNGKEVTTSLAGGRLGANIGLRDQTLPTMQAQLDTFSQTLAARFDAQGLTLFVGATGTVPPASTAVASPAGEVGFSADITVNPAIVANGALIRDGTHDVVGSTTGASSFATNTTRGSSDTTLIDRLLNFALGPDVQAGVVQPPAPTAGLGVGGTLSASFSGATDITSLATNVTSVQAETIGQAATDLTSETAIQTALTTKVSSVSGVSVDDEMASIVALQNAYQANAKVITAMQSMFSALLTAVT
jgi:flagellar hook-associated protein 1 FlgK